MSTIDRLLAGYQRFRKRYHERERATYENLASYGQSPEVAVISCCDSRVDPVVILDCKPGELFTVRNVANLVPPYEPEGQYHGTSAALEFAVRSLRVSHIIVLGHAQCGGVRALLDARYPGADQKGFVSGWMSIAREAREAVLADKTLLTPEARARRCEEAAIRVSLANLMTFPWIAEAVRAGKLHLHGWYFDIGAGELLRLDQTSSRFVNQD